MIDAMLDIPMYPCSKAAEEECTFHWTNTEAGVLAYEVHYAANHDNLVICNCRRCDIACDRLVKSYYRICDACTWNNHR